MPCTLHVAWDERLATYDFGAGHPMAPVRIELTIELARAFDLFGRAGVSVERPAPATDVQLQMVHIRRYMAAVRQAGGPGSDSSIVSFGLGTEDDPVFSGMHDGAGRWPARPWPRPDFQARMRQTVGDGGQPTAGPTSRSCSHRPRT